MVLGCRWTYLVLSKSSWASGTSSISTAECRVKKIPRRAWSSRRGFVSREVVFHTSSSRSTSFTWRTGSHDKFTGHWKWSVMIGRWSWGRKSFTISQKLNSYWFNVRTRTKINAVPDELWPLFCTNCQKNADGFLRRTTRAHRQAAKPVTWLPVTVKLLLWATCEENSTHDGAFRCSAVSQRVMEDLLLLFS